MVILTADEIRAVEQKCFDNYSTEAELMLRAGTKCFEAMTKKYNMAGKSVAVLCGNGKNAGDGFVIARLLDSVGALTTIVLCDKEPSIAEPLMYFEQARGVEVKHFTKNCLDVDFIVDCIFGIGFHGEPRKPFDEVFKAIEKTNATVISVDAPSGTNATTGEACNNCVRADDTIAISTLKYCHILPPANDYCGKIEVVDIGIPSDCYEGEYAQTIELDRNVFPKLSKNANKGSLGHQLNICSSYKMFGAGVIATQSALRSGAGLVKLVVPKSAYPLVASHLTQSVFNPVEENEEGTISKKAVLNIQDDLNWADSVVLGCGIGCNNDTEEVVDFVLKNAKSPVILDADGINSILSHISILKEIKVPVVLTPHPGEMARLISKTINEVQENRIEASKTFARENNVILVLKGANTVVTDGNRVFVNMNGNPSMAMGGTGDMLSGMIGAFIAQGVEPFEATKTAVYLHGLAGDVAKNEISQRGIVVDDMIDRLGALMSLFD